MIDCSNSKEVIQARLAFKWWQELSQKQRNAIKKEQRIGSPSMGTIVELYLHNIATREFDAQKRTRGGEGV